MIWYDTTNNQLKKRNEGNSAWITLGTVDEGAGTFTPSGERALATQAQAEAGTDNTTLMTPLRAAQAIAALATQEIPTFSAGTTPVFKHIGGASFSVSYTSGEGASLTYYESPIDFYPIKSGSLRVSVSMDRGSGDAAYLRVSKNGTILYTVSNTSATAAVYTYDVSFTAQDYINVQCGVKVSIGSGGGTESANFSDLKLLGNTTGPFRL